MAVQVITTTGAGTWTVPAGVTSIVVECWGGGRGGQRGSLGGGGGGNGGNGGDYAKKTLTVTPGASINYSVAASGAAGSTSTANGVSHDTWFSSTATVQARGGDRVNTSVGDVIYVGGDGGARSASAGGGGGGAGASSNANGANGDSYAAGSAGGAAGLDGGAGGAGGRTSAGEAGYPPGGGGGGGTDGFGSYLIGGAGAAGQIRITYIDRKAVRHAYFF